MPLREEDIKRIGDYVKPWLRNLVETMTPQPAFAGVGPELLERIVRVEEELKSQRELMEVRFDAADRRFQAMDSRFNDMQASIRATQWLIGAGFTLLTAAIAVFQFLS